MATKVPARADPATKVLPTENAAEGDGGASLPPEGEGAGELGGAGGESAAGPGDWDGEVPAGGEAAGVGTGAAAGVDAGAGGVAVGAGAADGGGVAGAVGVGAGADAGGGGVAVGGCVGAAPGACAMHEVARSPKMRSNCTAEEPMFWVERSGTEKVKLVLERERVWAVEDDKGTEYIKRGKLRSGGLRGVKGQWRLMHQ